MNMKLLNAKPPRGISRNAFKLTADPYPGGCRKNELELTLNKLSAARRTGEPAALTPHQCEVLLNRLDDLMLALERA